MSGKARHVALLADDDADIPVVGTGAIFNAFYRPVAFGTFGWFVILNNAQPKLEDSADYNKYLMNMYTWFGLGLLHFFVIKGQAGRRLAENKFNEIIIRSTQTVLSVYLFRFLVEEASQKNFFTWAVYVMFGILNFMTALAFFFNLKAGWF